MSINGGPGISWGNIDTENYQVDAETDDADWIE